MTGSIDIDLRRQLFSELTSEQRQEIGPTLVSPDELTAEEVSMVPAAWIDALSDLSVVPDLWRAHASTMPRILQWLDRSLIGVFLARTRMPVVDPMIGDPLTDVANVITLKYVVPDGLDLDDHAATVVMSGGPPWTGELPDYWESMAAATGDLVTGLHNGFYGTDFPGLIPIQAFHSAYDHWARPDPTTFREADGSPTRQPPDLHELVVVAERGPVVALDPARNDGTGWYGDLDGGFTQTSIAFRMENIIAYSAGAHFYDSIFA